MTAPAASNNASTSVNLRALLEEMIERDASDLHITAGERAKLRVDGDITNANLEVVERERVNRDTSGRGIGPKEVESILGQPTRSETTKLALETQKKEVDVVRYYYVQDGEEIALHFVDGKLISSVPKLGSLPQSPVGGPTIPAGTPLPPKEK